LCNFLLFIVPSSLLGPNFLRSTLFSNTHTASNQFSHPYKTTGKIILYCPLIPVVRRQGNAAVCVGGAYVGR